MSSIPESAPAIAGWRGRLKRTFRGLSWRAVGHVFVINTVVTAGLKVFGITNPFFDLLISAQLVGFSIMLAVYAGANARPRRRLRPLLLGACVVAGSIVGTFLVIVVKGRQVSALFNQVEALERFMVTTLLGIAVGSIATVVFSARTRVAESEAELHRADAERQRLARQMTEARLQVLQAQVEPHFLYNTLANVQHLIETDPPAASTMVDNLIRYLRAALPQMREERTTLGRDIEMVRAYLDILAVRLGARLRYRIELPAELAGVNFPPMMLLSLVENAIKHGIEPMRDGGEVLIRASRDEHALRLCVADSGRGLPATPGDGVGLSNLRERLRALYGDAARLTVERNAPQGTVATIHIPHGGPA